MTQRRNGEDDADVALDFLKIFDGMRKCRCGFFYGNETPLEILRGHLVAIRDDFACCFEKVDERGAERDENGVGMFQKFAAFADGSVELAYTFRAGACVFF